ncbi:MAG: hypothetical protein JWO36_1826 [Myxococcales bacterium]|nr:hypothetical protein [Myxococcales bacterium]
MGLACIIIAFMQAAPAPAGPHDAPRAPPTPRAPSPTPSAKPAISAPHGGVIEIVAITPDATAALTSDELGGSRLWPTLDGTREPLLVQLPNARELAFTRRADGYAVIALDAAGGIIVAMLDARGQTRSHRSLPIEPGFVEIVATEAGVLGWRKDQTLVLFGDDGTPKSLLKTEAGQHVVAIAAAGKVAVAAIETAVEGVRRVRSLSLEPKLAWGNVLEVGPRVGGEIAISPNGEWLASIEVVAATGARKILISNAAHKGTGPTEQEAGDTTELAFLDDNHLMLAGPSGTQIASFTFGATSSVAALPNPATGAHAPHAVLAVASGLALVGFDGELQVVTPKATQYLGYALSAPKLVRTAGAGELVIGIGTDFMRLDHSLEVASTVSVPTPPGIGPAELRWLGGSEWLAEATKEDGKTALMLLDLQRGTPSELRSNLTSVELLLYEPSTNLLTLSMNAAPEVDRFDPATHKLEKLGTLPKSKPYEQTELVPVSPKLANGAQILRVTMRDRVTIQWLHDPRALDQASSTVTVEGSLAATDAAGHAYVWRNVPAGRLELGIYSDGKAIGVLPTEGPVTLWPDPTGTRVAEVGARNVMLYTLDGKRVWNLEIPTMTEALWADDDSLAVISAAGIARLDAKTGTVTAARCGWGFGLSPKPHPPNPRIEPLCTQLAH